MAWGPAIDGAPTGLVDVPFSLIQKGQFNRVCSALRAVGCTCAFSCPLPTQVPFMMGTNANEGSIFTPMMLVIVKGLTVRSVKEFAHDTYENSASSRVPGPT